MQITVSARHCDVSDALRERATQVLERIGKQSDRATEATVLFETLPVGHRVELRLHVVGGQVLVAAGEAGDPRSALDRAEEKLRRQVTRTTEAPRTRRRTASGPA